MKNVRCHNVEKTFTSQFVMLRTKVKARIVYVSKDESLPIPLPFRFVTRQRRHCCQFEEFWVDWELIT